VIFLAEHFECFEIANATAKNQFGHGDVLLCDCADIHRARVDQHAPRIEHVPKGIAAALPRGFGGAKGLFTSWNDLVTIEQGLAAGIVYASSQMMNLRAQSVDVVLDLVLDFFHARLIASVDEIVRRLGEELREGDQVVILSNGGFGGIHEKLLRALRGEALPPA